MEEMSFLTERGLFATNKELIIRDGSLSPADEEAIDGLGERFSCVMLTGSGSEFRKAHEIQLNGTNEQMVND